MNKKEYTKPSTEAIELKMNQQLLAGSPGDSIHTGDPVSPGSSISRELFDSEEWDVLLGE